jgi:hypothetical protein
MQVRSIGPAGNTNFRKIYRIPGGAGQRGAIWPKRDGGPVQGKERQTS